MKSTIKTIRRLVVFVIGSTLLLFGFILIFLPGPAIIVIPVGLAILATEFLWARRLLNKIKDETNKIKKKIKFT